MQSFSYNNQTFQAYLAQPEQAAKATVLVFHAWWGLTPFFTGICDRLAKAGFTSLAPDFFQGNTAQTIEEAQALRSQADRKQAKKVVRTAIDFLATFETQNESAIGTIGFSYGCGFAIEAARLRPARVKAVTLFYGTGGGKLDKTKAVFQGHFAEHDEWGATPKKAQKLEQRIIEANQTATFYIYPDKTHWFFEADNPAYDASAAQLAWQRTIDFLDKQIG
ncbi:MAG: dienelactone hydrolase family protein [Chloroflexota bacterium]